MANKSLTDLTARTATADSDLLHINSGGTDYKETKANFLKGDFQHSFANTSTLTSQVDALAIGTYFGTIAGYGSQTTTGLPINANCYVKVTKMSATTASIEIWSSADVEGQHYISTKTSNAWGSWVHVPNRSEITALNNSLTNSLLIGTPYTDTISLANAGVNVVDVSIGNPPTISGYTFQFWIPVSSTYRFAPMGYGSTRLYYYVGTTSTSGGVVIFYPIYSKN